MSLCFSLVGLILFLEAQEGFAAMQKADCSVFSLWEALLLYQIFISVDWSGWMYLYAVGSLFISSSEWDMWIKEIER